ncbi:MAG: hypothetical protein ACOZD0_03110 [Pseudomonadota bacterium]
MRTSVNAAPTATPQDGPREPTPVESPPAHDTATGDTIPRRQENGEPGQGDRDADTSTPRLPHERDESADSQTGPRRDVIEQARRDVENGQQDTGRGPVTDNLYKRTLRGNQGETHGSPDPASSGDQPAAGR